MLSKLNKLPNPQETAQSLKPLKRASSMRKDQGKKRVDHFDDYIDPEGTGDFKDHTFDKVHRFFRDEHFSDIFNFEFFNSFSAIAVAIGASDMKLF